MPPISVLIKPASSACNMQCDYCFYRDVSQYREHSFEGMLSCNKMEEIIRSAMEYAEGFCTFIFQGGEPTLAGLEFFINAVALEKKYKKPGVYIQNSIQTNGYCINEEWAKFFSDQGFLVGISLDGPASIHDFNRKNTNGKGTFNRVMQTISLLDKWKVEYSILCVITGMNAGLIEEIYNFYKKNNFRTLQFIPCLEPLGQERGKETYHLSVEQYGKFLLEIFDLWFMDLKKGKYISIRHLDNWLAILLGNKPEACNMTGYCSIQFVIEGDGGVYPCDFYSTDEWRIGTVGKNSFYEIIRGELTWCFLKESFHIPSCCKQCSVFFLCRNGCRRDRFPNDESHNLNYYCAAYRRFFLEKKKELIEAVKILTQMQKGIQI